MSELLWIRSHVELLLQQEWDSCRVVADADGDWCFRGETASCWVTIVDGDVPMVRVVGHAVCGLRPTAKLLRELNDIELRALTARVIWVDDCVLVTQTISPIGLTRPVLAQALSSVVGIADDIGPLLAAMFDGVTPHKQPASDTEDEGVA